MRRRVPVLMLLGLPLAIHAGCADDADDCAPSAQSDACNWPDDRIEQCGAASLPASGIYGTSSWSCAAHCPPGPTVVCEYATLTLTDAKGHITSRGITGSGFYTLPLPPGDYELCAAGGAAVYETDQSSCVPLSLPAGLRVRVDVSTVASPGGVQEEIRVYPYATAGMPCGDAYPKRRCVAGLSCLPDPKAGTCQPPMLGDRCGPEVGECPLLQICAPSSHANANKLGANGAPDEEPRCLKPSYVTGPCADGVNACPTDSVGVHCDDALKKCVNGADTREGAWCSLFSDCGGAIGLDCFDTTGHRPTNGATGLCSLRRGPGERCDEDYQCAGSKCTNGTCAPLIATGNACFESTNCESGKCLDSVCE